MFEDRVRKFQLSFGPEDEKIKRERFAVRLRKDKRLQCQKRRRDISDMECHYEASYDFQYLIQELANLSDPLRVLHTLQAIKEKITYEKYSLKDLVYTGLIERLAYLCNPLMGEEVVEINTWILCNIAAEDLECATALERSGCINCLFVALQSTSVSVIENSLWALSNLVSQGQIFCESIIQLKVLKKVFKLVHSNLKISLCNVIAWLLRNIACYAEGLASNEINLMISICSNVIDENEETKNQAMWCLAYLAREAECIELMLILGLFERALELIYVVPAPALTLIGNICADKSEFSQILAELGLLDALQKVLEHGDKDITSKVLWVLSNFVANGQQAIEYLLNHSLFPICFDSLESLYGKALKKFLKFLKIVTKLCSSQVKCAIFSDISTVHRLIASCFGADAKTQSYLIEIFSNILHGPENSIDIEVANRISLFLLSTTTDKHMSSHRPLPFDTDYDIFE